MWLFLQNFTLFEIPIAIKNDQFFPHPAAAACGSSSSQLARPFPLSRVAYHIDMVEHDLGSHQLVGTNSWLIFTVKNSITCVP